ncbi:MAG: acyltransferase [Candidatus Levybacteria bacterium]|nr:acyltransferase [Candidatus Levybacteria bacterium]
MKERVSFLDGLRGFAAISVVIGHLHLETVSYTHIPILSYLFYFISNGVNAVQIFFVLSGFLMAYLYPTISSPFLFIKRRYARIFPLLGVIVLMIGISTFLEINLWYQQLLLLILIALITAFAWRILKNTKNVGNIIFLLFIALQVTIGSIYFLMSITSSMQNPDNMLLPTMANLTLTTPLLSIAEPFRSPFWSLAPEVLFYLVYPFFVIPLINYGKKKGLLFNIVMVVIVTKILFDLDSAVISLANLQTMHIGRSSGFIVGVLVGSIYSVQGKSWMFLKEKLAIPKVDLVVLALFIFMQTNYFHITDLNDYISTNLYFLISSIIIGLTILCALSENNIINKIFTHKVLMFLGVISYSLYIVHQDVINWMTSIFPKLSNNDVQSIVFSLIAIAVTIGIAFFLNRVVESLYFSSKKSIKLNKTKESIKQDKSFLYVSMKLVILMIFLLVIYVARYSPSFFIHRHNVSKSLLSSKKALIHEPYEITFYSSHNNLSIVSLDMKYKKSASETQATIKKPAILQFELYDSKNILISNSKRAAYLVEGAPHFDFGFSPIHDSASKNYKIKLILEGGSRFDQVFLDTSSTSMVTKYIIPVKISSAVFSLILNRLVFFANTIPAIFALIFFAVIFILDKKIPTYPSKGK